MSPEDDWLMATSFNLEFADGGGAEEGAGSADFGLEKIELLEIDE